MRNRLCYIFFVGFLVSLYACVPDKKYAHTDGEFEVLPVHYAKGFTIRKYADYTLLTVRHPQDTANILGVYFLINRNKTVPPQIEGEKIIRTPAERIVCASTTHVGFLNALDLRNKIVGLSGVMFVYDSVTQTLIDNGSIREIGLESALNIELLVALRPDVFMTYLYDDPAYSGFDKMDALQLNSVLNNEYLETTPLGQAEWIKFVAAFFEVETKADSLFQKMEQDYLQVKALTEHIQLKPTVLTGLPFKGEWTVPGGKSFAATYLADAGAAYLWNTNNATGNFPVAFEEVIDKAVHADVWLNAGAKTSLQQIAETDVRLKNFKAWESGAIYNNNNRVNANGGNDYWESAVVNPHIVLRDLVKILHPELLPEHTFVYYRKLQP